MRKLFLVLILALLVVSLATGCALESSASPANTPDSTRAPAQGATSSPAVSAAPTNAAAAVTASTASLNPAPGTTWQADGVANEGEYTHQGTAGPLTLSWHSDSTYLYVALQARTMGWLSIGFDPDRTHIGADIIIGAVANGSLVLLDSYGTSERGTFHTPDTDLGGSNDIVASAGTYADGITTIEFKLPLDSGDQYDKPLQAGSEVGIILAVGSTSDLTSMHSYATFGTLTLD